MKGKKNEKQCVGKYYETRNELNFFSYTSTNTNNVNRIPSCIKFICIRVDVGYTIIIILIQIHNILLH
jgi:hypothetical protein